MPNRTVAVEEGLDNVVDELQRRGYTTIELLPESVNSSAVEAMVVSGGDSNFMGIQDRSTSVPVINTEGMNAEEVVEQVERRIRARRG